MAVTDWTTVKLPAALIDRLDEFLGSKDAKKMGVGTRPEVIKMLLRNFLDKWEAEKD